MKVKFLIGIDEAGRGPIAGPVSVGAVCIPLSCNVRDIRGVRDSKKCSEKEREMWYRKAVVLQKEGKIRFASALVSASYIDTKGISSAVRLGIKKILQRLDVDPKECEVRLDGLLRAPKDFYNQKTIIRGDQTEPVISFASIIAKVRRDRHMKNLSRRYPSYGFEQHKGYGTDLHYERLREYGVSDIHRATYLKDFFQ